MPPDLQNRFEAMIDFINEAIDKVKDGKSIDLGNLNREVDMLCADATKAGDASVKPLMAELISRLDELAVHLTELKKKFTNGH